MMLSECFCLTSVAYIGPDLESGVRVTSVPILVFLGLSVLDLGRLSREQKGLGRLKLARR